MPEQLAAILDRWTQTVYAALYLDADAATRRLEDAESELRAIDRDASEIGILETGYALLRSRIAASLAGHQTEHGSTEAGRALLAAKEACSSRMAKESAPAAFLANALLQMEVDCDRLAISTLTPEMASALLAMVSESERDYALWSRLGFWAFQHGLADQMFLVYTEFLVRRKRSLTRYGWERLRLMYLLTAGQAIFRDVEAVIDKFPDGGQAALFGQYIKPRCEDTGVWDERLQMKFELRLIDLEDQQPAPPPPGGNARFRSSWDGIEVEPRSSSSEEE